MHELKQVRMKRSRRTKDATKRVNNKSGTASAGRLQKEMETRSQMSGAVYGDIRSNSC